METWLIDGLTEAVKYIVGGLVIWLWRRVRTFTARLRQVVEDHASARAVEERCLGIEARLLALEQGVVAPRPAQPLERISVDFTDPNPGRKDED